MASGTGAFAAFKVREQMNSQSNDKQGEGPSQGSSKSSLTNNNGKFPLSSALHLDIGVQSYRTYSTYLER